ncbi:MAG: S46 family peptidase [Bacteroidales bacterium]|nr:S46 family peptidase [Bacteroidales bacterium]
MKKLLVVIIACLAGISARADEGMWLPSLIHERIADMQAKGFKLSAEDIYSINQASLKDAVMMFGRGCSAELLSGEGLILTNYHCGYAQIQKHSSVEHDYLKDGFWAMKREEELPNPGLSVSFLERMEDVTSIVLRGYTPDMTEEQRIELIRHNSTNLIDIATSAGKGLRATVEALYYGNQYFLFVYREFKDVRFVGAPPTSIGKFGGETDNWMWPRHTGDFSLFRIYADKDNNPAEYSKDNVPYQPKKYFKISTGGIKEGDFTFIYGFPGYTQEYIHSEGVRYISEISDPCKVALRTLRLDIMNKHMSKSQAVRIQYSTKKAIVANAWKKWQGEAGGIKKMKTVQTNQDYEKRFIEWAKGTEYEGIVEHIDSIYKELETHHFIVDIFSETAQTIEISRLARQVSGHSLESVKNISKSFFKDYYMPIDKECFVALMKEFGNMIPDDHQPAFYKEQMQKYGKVETWADSLFANSVFADEAKMESLGENYHDVLIHDPASIYYIEMQNWALPHLNKARALNRDLQLLYRTYMRGQMDFAPDRTVYYPDANLTLRVSYGHIKGYSPYDGAYYHPSSTLKGIIEKDNPEIFDYNIPQKLRDIYHNKDFGRWVDERGEVPVCFIATNHTTGGNSGSPVINAEGNLIGINFDRVWEGTMSDIDFDLDFCRNISLDIRYVLFTIEKIGGAAYLFDEMTFVE